MFAGQDLFYFATMRKITLAFGQLFNDVYIQRFENPSGSGQVLKTIKVPISHTTGEKWFTHKEQDISIQTNARSRISYPRMSFMMTGMQYDANRQLKSTNTTLKHISSPQNGMDVLKQLSPVPYDFTFELYIGVKNIDDGLQIIEQIVPAFQPSYNLNIKDIPELGLVRDIPVILTSVSPIDDVQGSFEDNRVLEWTLTFNVKGYIYNPIRDGKVIRQVIASLYSNKELHTDSKTGVISVKVDPINAAFVDDWDAETNIYNAPDDLDSDGQPIEIE